MRYEQTRQGMDMRRQAQGGVTMSAMQEASEWVEERADEEGEQGTMEQLKTTKQTFVMTAPTQIS